MQKIFGGGLQPSRPTGSSCPARPTTATPPTRPSTRPAPRSWSTSTRPSTGRRPLNLSPSPTPLAIKVVQIIQQMWQQVGFDVTVSEVEQATLINDFIARASSRRPPPTSSAPSNPDLNYVWWSTTTVSPGRHHRPQLRPQLRPDDRDGHARGPPHHRPGHPGQPPTRRSTSSWPRISPTCGSSSTSSPRWPRPGPELRQSDPPQRHARATASTKASSSPRQIWLAG